MSLIQDIYKKITGTNGKTEKTLKKREDEAVAIKSGMHKDILNIKRKIDKLNRTTYHKLSKISVDLESITYKIAVVTGGKKRGLE